MSESKSKKSKDSKKKSSSKDSKKTKTESHKSKKSSSRKDSKSTTPKKSSKSKSNKSKSDKDSSKKRRKSKTTNNLDIDQQSMKTGKDSQNADQLPDQFEQQQHQETDMNVQNLQNISAYQQQQRPAINNNGTAYSNFGGGEQSFGGGLQRNLVAQDLNMCMLHKKPLRYFCESCEELICYDCTVMGPHNTQLHRVSSLDDAYRYRLELINRQIHQNLVPKRAQLIGQIVRMDHRLDEVKTVKSVIERDIRNEYSAIMERLRSAEGVKTAVLQHDIAEVQKDITRIDEILMFMEEVVQPKPQFATQDQNQAQTLQETQGPDYLAFLHNFRQLNENIEYSVTKQFKVEIAVVPNDLPRELAERQSLMEHYEEQRKLLKFKDDTIWKLSQELKKKYDFYQDVCDKETRHEMNEWVRLVDGCVSELKKYELVCAFCGRHLSDHNVNTDCLENTGRHASLMAQSDVSQQDAAQLTQQTLYFTEDEPNLEIIGKKRHWFGKPSLKGYKQNSMRNQSSNSLLKDEITLQNSDLSDTLKHLTTDDCLNALREQFTVNDDQRIGVLKKNQFINILFENCTQAKPADLMTFVNSVCTSYQDVVNYDQVLQLLDKYREDPHRYSSFQQSRENLISQRMNKKDREFLDKVRSEICDNNPKDAFRKFGKNNDLISQDELLLALSRLNANFFLGDVKQLFNIVKENSATIDQGAEDEIVITELLKFLKL